MRRVGSPSRDAGQVAVRVRDNLTERGRSPRPRPSGGVIVDGQRDRGACRRADGHQLVADQHRDRRPASVGQQSRQTHQVAAAGLADQRHHAGEIRRQFGQQVGQHIDWDRPPGVVGGTVPALQMNNHIVSANNQPLGLRPEQGVGRLPGAGEPHTALIRSPALPQRPQVRCGPGPGPRVPRTRRWLKIHAGQIRDRQPGRRLRNNARPPGQLHVRRRPRMHHRRPVRLRQRR